MTITEDVWQTIVAESLEKALQVTRGRPVPGSRLRQIVATIARKHGEQYPAPDNDAQKFGDFLKQFSSLLIVLRRTGSDFLVAPADRPDLLAGEQEDRYAFVRDDVFEAFTRVPRESPPKEAWYDKDDDKFNWIQADGLIDTGRLIKVPGRTQDEEIEERRAFAMLPQYEKIQDDLLATLSEHAAFWAFSRAIKERGLGRNWHLFRMQAVVKRIRLWCEQQQIPWRDEWLTRDTTSSAPEVFANQQRPDSLERATLIKLLAGLSDADLQRIVIPLDLLLKLLGQR